MFCTNCGLKLAGKFCASCGARAASCEDVPEVIPVGDWHHETCYATLLRYPEVRERLALVPECAKNVSAEEWIALYDEAFKPLTGVSMKTVVAIAAPIYAKMGVKTGKKRTEMLAEPPGLVMVDVLCALAKHGLPLTNVHQGSSGCVFEAKFPSDFWASEGKVVVSVEHVGDETKVEAATNIPGQLFDWGKSVRCLENLFGHLNQRAA
jgi:hypothetical protein